MWRYTLINVSTEKMQTFCMNVLEFNRVYNAYIITYDSTRRRSVSVNITSTFFGAAAVLFTHCVDMIIFLGSSTYIYYSLRVYINYLFKLVKQQTLINLHNILILTTSTARRGGASTRKKYGFLGAIIVYVYK